MRASLASLLLTSLVLTSPALAAPKGRAKKAPKKKATPTAPAPADTATPPPPDAAAPANALGDPADASPPAPAPAPDAVPASPAPPSGPTLPANGPKPGTPAAKAKAKALQKEATKLYNVQQYARAAELYQQAYLYVANPAYLYASAQSQRLGGDCTKALQSYQAYLRANPPENERAKATANIERCEQELREREAAVSAEQLSTIPYDVPAPPPPPPEEKPLPPPPPPPPPEKSYIVGHVLLGLGVAAIGGGSYLYYAGRKQVQDFNDLDTYDAFVDGMADVESGQTNQKIGLAVAGGGLALIGGAIAYYVIHAGSDDEEAPPPVSANVTANSASVTFQLSF